MSVKFTSFKDFENWLETNNWFQDGCCLQAEHDKVNDKLVLILAYQINGTYEANSERTRRVFQIVADDIIDISQYEASDLNQEHCMEGIDLCENEEYIEFSLDIPKLLKVRCRRIYVTKKENLTDIVKPWLSETELFVDICKAKMPSPADWVCWFNKYGADVSWRFYGGEARESNNVPSKNYDGWFIQESNAIQKTTEGLFFQHVNIEDGKTTFHVRRNEFSDATWVIFKRILLKFENAIISSGNCKLNCREWRHLLSNVQENG